MLTVKQLQAFYWTAKLGTLGKAGERLHITQSAATKRLQELESVAVSPLFQSAGRRNELTRRGHELTQACEELFGLLDALDALTSSPQAPVRELHIGLTDVSASTWFPAFVHGMREAHPAMALYPEVAESPVLIERLRNGDLDFAFLPDPPVKDGLKLRPLGQVAFAWFSAPGAYPKGKRCTLEQLARSPVIEQTGGSLIARLYDRQWPLHALPRKIRGGNNAHALAELVMSGLGVACLPRNMFAEQMRSGKLEPVDCKPPAPMITYYGCSAQTSLGVDVLVQEIASQSFEQFESNA